jgi:hypothetical protein
MLPVNFYVWLLIIKMRKEMTKKEKEECPCPVACHQRRAMAVNFILKKESCTSNELRLELRDKGIGTSVIRKSIEFLSSNQCRKVETLYWKAGNKILQFPKHGRLFYRKNIGSGSKTERVLGLLTPLQVGILKKFSKLHQSIYYFSLYDLRRLMPSAGNSVDYAVDRLTKLDLIKAIALGGFDIYTEPKNTDKLRAEEREVIVENKVEFAVIHRIHELMMNLYPLHLITNLHEAVRPHTKEALSRTGGMTFDIFYEFREPIMDKKFLAIDVYSRIPVNGYVINSFLKKIEWAKISIRGRITYNLRDRTFAMIVFRNSTRKAIDIANKHGIRFIRLADAKIDYKALRKETESEIQDA